MPIRQEVRLRRNHCGLGAARPCPSLPRVTHVFSVADLKWAFDVADVNLMLFTCYEAGIVDLDWQMLDDFFRLDVASVVVGGCPAASRRC